MSYQIELIQSAIDELRLLRRTDQVGIMDTIDRHLAVAPKAASRSRIKVLRDAVFPPFRMRIGDFRVFYDVLEEERKVIVYGIVAKADALDWLARSTERHRGEHP